MPSSRRRSQPDADLPTFFVDRGLGRRHVPAVFTAAGLEVVLMAELYSKGSDQIVPDDVWIADVSARGWVALTKDTSVIRHHHEVVHKDRVERRWPSTAVGGGPSGDRRRDGGEKVRSADG